MARDGYKLPKVWIDADLCRTSIGISRAFEVSLYAAPQ